MTAKSLIKGALPTVTGVVMVGLAIHYLGDKPFFKQVKDGLNGNVNGTWLSRLFN